MTPPCSNPIMQGARSRSPQGYTQCHINYCWTGHLLLWNQAYPDSIKTLQLLWQDWWRTQSKAWAPATWKCFYWPTWSIVLSLSHIKTCYCMRTQSTATHPRYCWSARQIQLFNIDRNTQINKTHTHTHTKELFSPLSLTNSILCVRQ